MASRTAVDIAPSIKKQYRPFRSSGKDTTADHVSAGKAVAAAIAKELKERFGVSRVILFGSLTEGNFNKWSDIDLAVCGAQPGEYYRMVAFASGFSEVFKVDLVDVEDCSDSLRQHILQQGADL